MPSPVATAGGGYFHAHTGVHFDKDGNYHRGIQGAGIGGSKSKARKSIIPAGALGDDLSGYGSQMSGVHQPYAAGGLAGTKPMFDGAPQMANGRVAAAGMGAGGRAPAPGMHPTASVGGRPGASGSFVPGAPGAHAAMGSGLAPAGGNGSLGRQAHMHGGDAQGGVSSFAAQGGVQVPGAGHAAGHRMRGSEV